MGLVVLGCSWLGLLGVILWCDLELSQVLGDSVLEFFPGDPVLWVADGVEVPACGWSPYIFCCYDPSFGGVILDRGLVTEMDHDISKD